jgi:hypothetical protein
VQRWKQLAQGALRGRPLKEDGKTAERLERNVTAPLAFFSKSRFCRCRGCSRRHPLVAGIRKALIETLKAKTTGNFEGNNREKNIKKGGKKMKSDKQGGLIWKIAVPNFSFFSWSPNFPMEAIDDE